MSFTKIDNNNIAASGVTPGTYSTANITVNEAGQITSASVGVAGDTAAKITTIQITNSGGTVLDDTAVDVSGGYIKVLGTGFSSGCQVYVNQTAATSTTFISSTTVTAQVPAMPAGTYIVYLVNTDGATATKVTGLTYSSTPTWITAAGDLGSYLKEQSVNIQLSATGATNYVLASGSTFPGTLSINSSGLITGTTPDVATNTVYSFTIEAVDDELQDSSRTFSITVQPIVKTFTISPAVSGKSSWNLLNDGALNLTSAGSWTLTATSSFTAPVKVWGAAGGGVNGQGGGGGGYATGIVNFTSGNTYLLVVGSGGGYSTSSSGGSPGVGVGAGGNAQLWGGTGGAGSATNGAGGGGAGSGLFYPASVTQANSVLLGGGGSGTNGYTPGAGGGTSGQNGTGGFGDTAGKGGTQSAAGAAGSERYSNEGNFGSAGSGMNGGSGGSGINGTASAPRNGGGAGGGGYFGGGGGSGGGGASGTGGGGSGRVSTDTNLVTSGSTTTGNGISPGNSTDANRAASAGLGVATSSGGAGQIYIAF